MAQLTSTAGNDTIYGGVGNNTFTLTQGSGLKTIYDYDTTSGNIDTVIFSNVPSTGLRALERKDDDLVISYGVSDELTIKYYFNLAAYLVEQLKFSDGVVWDQAAVKARVIANGTDGNDNLYGYYNGPNQIFGLAGNDNILSFAGNDRLSGGLGNDTLYGGGGTDQLLGDEGDDIISSGQLYDSVNNAWLPDDQGDMLDGGSGNDTLSGNNGNDTLIGGTGNDSLHDYSGNNMLSGGSGNDTLYSGAGNDTLDGGGGVDVLYGGDGDDIYYIRDRVFSGYDSGGNDSAIISVNFAKLPENIEHRTWVGGAQALPYWIDALTFGHGQASAAAKLAVGVVYYGFPDVGLQRTAADQGFAPLPETHRAFVRSFFNTLSTELGIVFTETTGQAALENVNTIIFSGAILEAGVGGDGGDRVRVNVLRPFDPSNIPKSLYTHEIGHVLGLKHPFGHVDARGNIGEGPYLPEAEDNTQWSVMSYTYGAHDANSHSPFDLAALQYLYGVSTKLNAGNNSYTLSPLATNFIADGAGVDTLSAAGLNQAATLYLEPGYWGFIGQKAQTISAAGQVTVNFGTVIENLIGGNAADNLFGNTGNNVLTGGAGNDSVDGGGGIDTLNYTGNFADYAFGYSAGVITIEDKNLTNGNDGTDRLINSEVLHFTDKDLTLVDGLRYIASYADLINAYHANADAGISHYLRFGFAQGRTASFDAQVYIDKYADVRALVGTNLNTATLHFINNGFGENRNASLISADKLFGTASTDNIKSYGGNDTVTGAAGNDSIDGGSGSDTANYAGKFADYGFSVSAGAIIIEDKNLANGNDGSDTLSNVETLHFVDRDLTVVNGLSYIASYADLINVYHGNADAGLSHYLRAGFAEGRTASFDAQVYLDKYADVRALAGSDLNAATLHFINNGFSENRSASLTSADNLVGTAGSDNIKSSGGNDTIMGAAGNDSIDGGSGIDTANFAGNFGDYNFSVSAGAIIIEDKNLTNGNDGSDTLINVEKLHFVDKDLTMVNGLSYIASYADLINAYHANADAGISHYLRFGFAQGRKVSFDAQVYIDKYADVRALAGTNLNTATLHFINSGFGENRSASLISADNLVGTNGNDNINAYGGNDTVNGGTGNDSVTGGVGNDIIDGGSGTDTANFSGKFAEYGFSVNSGAIIIEDKNLANGNDGSDTLRNVEKLRFVDKELTAVNGLSYIASYADLINIYHANADAGLSHYLRLGFIEGRQASFDAQVYVNKYADVRLLAGSDLNVATSHYINTGFTAGRNVNLNSADSLLGTSSNDNISAYGGNDTVDGSGGNDSITGGSGNDALNGGFGADTANYTGNLLDYGFAVSGGVITIEDKNLANGNDGIDTLRNFEKLHFANKDVAIVDGLRYIASYGDLINAFHGNSDAGLNHYLNSGANEGRYVRFDPSAYLAKYADLRNAFGSDLAAATGHFINFGFAEGRTSPQLPAPVPAPQTVSDYSISLVGNSLHHESAPNL